MIRRLLPTLVLALSLACTTRSPDGGRDGAAGRERADADEAPMSEMQGKIEKTDEEWREILTPEQYHVTREEGTERPFTGEYYKTKTPGVYVCVCCGQELFGSGTKYESGTGWPSFYAPIDEENVETKSDHGHGMVRVEVECSRCGAHLGHVFEDGPEPTGLRYCINSAALELEPEDGGAESP